MVNYISVFSGYVHMFIYFVWIREMYKKGIKFNYCRKDRDGEQKGWVRLLMSSLYIFYWYKCYFWHKK